MVADKDTGPPSCRSFNVCFCQCEVQKPSVRCTPQRGYSCGRGERQLLATKPIKIALLVSAREFVSMQRPCLRTRSTNCRRLSSVTDKNAPPPTAPHSCK